MRARRYFQKTGKKVTINGSDTAGNQESRPRNQDSSRKTVIVEDTSSKAIVAIDGVGYRPKDSKSVCIDTSNEIKKALDAPLIEDWVSDSDEDEYKEMVLKFDNVQHKPKQANQPRIGTGQRVVEPVLNNAMRTNHHNFSSSRRSFALTAVLTKSAIVQISTARQSSSRAATPVSADRPINTATSKPLVNVAKPRSNDFQKSHSLSRRHSYQQTTPKNTNLNNNVNAAKENSVNTAKGNKVTSAIGKHGINTVKSSACWGAPQNALKDQGYFDSGCSRHMIGNISYLADVKEHWNYHPIGVRFLIASRFPTPPLASSPAIVEPLHIELPFQEDQLQEDPPEDPPEVPMADNRTMAELLQVPTEGYEDVIVIPKIAANNFKLKHGLINLVQDKQFFGHDKDDPHAQIRYFNKITSTMRVPNIPSSSIKLMLFPFSLKGETQIWLEKEPPQSILTWDDLVSKFINQFFELHQLDTFYNELNVNDQDSLNSVAGGNFLDKIPRECLKIIESKSKVRQSRAKAIIAKVSTSSSTLAISFDVAELKDMLSRIVLLGVVLTRIQNCPATSGNVYRDNIQEEDLKGITTQSGVAYQGPTIPTSPKVVKQGTEVTKDQVQTPSLQSTAPVQPLVVQSETQTLVFEPVVAPVELKDLPPYLEYAFLEGDNKLPVIISKELGDKEKSALIKVLMSHKQAIAWKLSDIQGINPEFCTCKILMEEDYKPAVQNQRRVKPKIHDVIKKEVEKLLDAGLIYPISDSPWVSPLVYGKACHLLIELEHKTYWALKQANFNLAVVGDHRKVQLNELNELRDHAYENSLIYKEKTKRIHDSEIKNRVFNVGDRVLLFNSRMKIFSGKLKTRWSGPFTIAKVFPYGTAELSQANGPNFKVNGHRVKHYFGGDDFPDCKVFHALSFVLHPQELRILSFIFGI
nr:reverse transcriptase domain-containing protein [Tanacetum cinerariifolium]